MVEQLNKRLSNPDTLVSLFLGLAVVAVIGVMIFNFFRDRGKAQTTNNPEQKTEQSATGTPLPTSYTVAAGESLWSIAQKTIGSGYNWTDIAETNKLSSPDNLTVGQKLTIPNVAKREPGQIANANVEVKRPADGRYTVKTGDSLWKISLEVYGTGYRWTEIATQNKLSNPDLIFNGNVLTLP